MASSCSKWTSSIPSSQGSWAVGGSRRVGAGRGRRGAQVEVGALSWRGRRAALLSWQVLGAGGRGWRIGVRVWVKVHVVLVVFAMVAMARGLPAARWWCQASRRMVRGVVTVTNISAAGSSGWCGTSDWMVWSNVEETELVQIRVQVFQYI